MRIIDPNKLYRPSTIAKNGWVQSLPYDGGDPSYISSYQKVLALIGTRKLPAINIGLSKRPSFVVLGKDLKKYLKLVSKERR